MWDAALQPGGIKVLLDGLGREEQREITVDELKSRFFALGVQIGIASQMCARRARPVRLGRARRGD